MRDITFTYLVTNRQAVGCRHIESCEYHRFFSRHFCGRRTRCIHNPLDPPGKGAHFLSRELFVSIRTSLLFLSTVSYTSLLRSLFTVEKNDKMITCGKWERIDAFWPICGITAAFIFRTVDPSKDLVRIAGV